MKFTSKELRMVIREVVEEEISRVLPKLISQVLAENYLRKIVAESVGTRVRSGGLRETLMDDEQPPEETPAPLANSNQGIYQKSPIVKEQRELPRVLADSPFADIFKDVRPVPSENSPDQISAAEAAGFADPGLPIEQMGGDFDHMKKLLEGMNRKAMEKKDMSDPAQKLKELEERRKMLDVPANRGR